MFKRSLTIIWLVLTITWLIVYYTPLEYKNSSVFWGQFWMAFGLTIWVTFLHVKKKWATRLAIILTPSVTPVVVLIFVFYMGPRRIGDIETIPIPGSDKVFVIREDCIPMIASCSFEISLGYAYLNGYMVWRSGAIYNRLARGDDYVNWRKYNLPQHLSDREGVFVFPKEGYAIDMFNKKLYKLGLKK